MAGRGPAPAEDRARANAPARGEWQELPPLERPVLPALPKRPRGAGPWSARTRRVWEAWRLDWATGFYGPVEVAMAVELAWAYEEFVRAPKPALMAEIRRWMDGLGLTAKGKVDLRLRLEDTAPAVAAEGEEDETSDGAQSAGERPASARERYGQLRPVG
jgi:hypothetical protein